MVGLKSWWRKLWGAPKPLPEPPRNTSAEQTADYETPPPLTMPMPDGELRVGVVTTRGNVRRRNEDNFYVPGKPSLQHAPSLGPGPGSSLAADDFPSGLITPGPPDLFIVADGMGGQLAGEKASQLAVELIPTHLAGTITAVRDDNEIRSAILDAIEYANNQILSQSSIHLDYANMGTTVGLVLFRNRHVFVTGLGDTRVYHLHGSTFRQLTKDHSLANALQEAGSISPAEVETHRFKNILYLFLGSRDVHDRPEPVQVIDYVPGDQFLIASDGLTGVVKDNVIAEIMRSCEDPQRAAQQLVNRALDNMSKDNITCIVIRVL